MKTNIFFLSLLLACNLHAQIIIESLGYAGLLYPSGAPALELKYNEITNASYRSDEQSPIFIYQLDGKFGIFNMTDSSSTGCIYDSVYCNWDAIVKIEQNGLTGFLGYYQGKYTIVEPAYDYVAEPFADHDTLLPYWGKWTFFAKTKPDRISVKKNDLWGVVSYKDGSPVLPISYWNELQPSYEGPYYTSFHPSTNRKLIINPQTGAAFEMNNFARVAFLKDSNLLVAVDKHCMGNQGPIESHVWEYSTGRELWSHQSSAWYVTITVYSPEVILVKEDYIDEDKTVFTFYNITNRAELFHYTAEKKESVSVEPSENKLSVYVRPSHDSNRKKLVGEVFL